MTVTVYGKPHCPQCTATTRKLADLGLVYRYVDVTEDLDAACRLQAEGHLSLPVVEADDLVWVGFRPDLLGKIGVPG